MARLRFRMFSRLISASFQRGSNASTMVSNSSGVTPVRRWNAAGRFWSWMAVNMIRLSWIRPYDATGLEKDSNGFSFHTLELIKAHDAVNELNRAAIKQIVWLPSIDKAAAQQDLERGLGAYKLEHAIQFMFSGDFSNAELQLIEAAALEGKERIYPQFTVLYSAISFAFTSKDKGGDCSILPSSYENKSVQMDAERCLAKLTYKATLMLENYLGNVEKTRQLTQREKFDWGLSNFFQKQISKKYSKSELDSRSAKPFKINTRKLVNSKPPYEQCLIDFHIGT